MVILTNFEFCLIVSKMLSFKDFRYKYDGYIYLDVIFDNLGRKSVGSVRKSVGSVKKRALFETIKKF